MQLQPQLGRERFLHGTNAFGGSGVAAPHPRVKIAVVENNFNKHASTCHVPYVRHSARQDNNLLQTGAALGALRVLLLSVGFRGSERVGVRIFLCSLEAYFGSLWPWLPSLKVSKDSQLFRHVDQQ